jgi:hypothetical protein
VPVYIYLDDAEAVAKVGFQLLQDGVHGLTGAAPSGKEIGQDQLAAIDDIVEGFHRNLLFRKERAKR